MRLAERQWAQIGKALAALATLVGVIVGLLEIGQSVSGPQITALVSVEKDYISPRVRETLKQRVDRKALSSLIEGSAKRKEAPAKTLEIVNTRLNDGDKFDNALWELKTALDSTYLRITIQNTADVVAKDVRLILPGKGKAEISESGHFDVDAPAVAWEQELAVGPVRPGSKVEVLVWPEESVLMGLFGVNAAVTHAGGSGKVRYLQSFHGWDADLIAWFIAQPWFIRYTIGGIAVLLLVIAVRFLIRKGFINLHPSRSKNSPDRDRDDRSTSTEPSA